MAHSSEENATRARRLCEQGLWGEVLAFASQWSGAIPADPLAFYYLGLGHTGLGQFAQAETAYRRALAINPADPRVWNNLAAVLYEHLQRHAEAIHCIEQALQLDPGHKTGWANLATMLGRLGHYDKALACADKAIALDPNLVEAHLHKAAAALALGKTEIVKQVCLTLATIAPENFHRAR